MDSTKFAESISELGTRERILAAARRLVDEGGEAAATMMAVAKLSGVSRQSVYLHFADRAQLLIELSDYIDRELGLGDWMAQIASLHDGEDMLRLLALTRCQRSASQASLVRSIEGDRNRDAEARAAWQERHDSTIGWMSNVIVRQLRSEGRLHRSWPTREAASYLVMLFSVRNWDNLTQACEWPTDRYVEVMTATALSAMAGSSRPTRKRKGAATNPSAYSGKAI